MPSMRLSICAGNIEVIVGKPKAILTSQARQHHPTPIVPFGVKRGSPESNSGADLSPPPRPFIDFVVLSNERCRAALLRGGGDRALEEDLALDTF